MTRFVFVVFVLGLFFISAYGQTAAELEKKYGPPLNAYEIRRGVLLTAKYGADGQACEIVLENRHKSELGVELSDSITDALLEQMIDELVPESERGRKGTSYVWSINLGHSLQTDHSYENVEIVSIGTRVSKHKVVLIKWKIRQCM